MNAKQRAIQYTRKAGLQQSVASAISVKAYEQGYKDGTAVLHEGLDLLRTLADLQNDAPLEKWRDEWEQTMHKVYAFLDEHEKNNL